MRGTDALGALLRGSFAMLDERLTDVREDEWRARALPGTSKPGFILWHCARILDWTVRCAIEGEPEVADSARWQDRFPREAGAGFGISPELADRVCDSTSAREVASYLAEVRTASLAWFEKQTDDSLDSVPPMKANQGRRPLYLEPAAWEDIADLDGLPAWQLLMRPAGGHIRRHLGEYDVLLQAIRSGAASPRG